MSEIPPLAPSARYQEGVAAHRWESDPTQLALLPEFVCAEDIRAKRLRHVLPDWGSAAMPVHAVYPSARLLSPAAAAFIDLVRKRFTLGT